MEKRLKKLLLALGIMHSFTFIYAKESSQNELQQKCLACHRYHQIPSEMIYRRYLMRYSSKKIIKEKMFRYLKQPNKKNSIMPPPFFKKFPPKKPTKLDDATLSRMIKSYIQHYDISKKLKIVKE